MPRQVHKLRVETVKRNLDIPIRFEYLDGQFDAEVDGHLIKGDRYKDVAERVIAYAMDIDEADSALYYRLTVGRHDNTIQVEGLEVTEDVQGERKERPAHLAKESLVVTPSKTLRWTLFQGRDRYHCFVLIPANDQNRIGLLQLLAEGKKLDDRIETLNDRRTGLRDKFESMEGTIWEDDSEVLILFGYVKDVISGIEKEEAEAIAEQAREIEVGIQSAEQFDAEVEEGAE